MEARGGRAQAARGRGAIADWLWRNPCGRPGQSIMVSVAMGRRGSGRATGEMSMAWGWQWWLWGDRAERRHQGDPALAQEAGTEKPSGGGGRVGFHVLDAPGASPSGGDLVMS